MDDMAYRKPYYVWDDDICKLCISIRSLLNCLNSSGTFILIGSLNESGLPVFSEIVSFFLFQTVELNSVMR